jgi:hypothetical protein
LTFHYVEPTDGSGAFSCAGVIARDFGGQQCFAWNRSGLRSYTGIEFEPISGLNLLGVPVHLVPDVQVEYLSPNSEYQYFVDSRGDRYSTGTQVTFRASMGIDTRFTDRGRWGNAFMAKVGIACLLSDPVDLNERRRGCRKRDLDNWFAKASFARNISLGSRSGLTGFFRSELWFEMPDHDFAATSNPDPLVTNVHNDDGQHVLIANAMQYVFIPVSSTVGFADGLDLRLGLGGAFFRQHEQNATAQPDPEQRMAHSISAFSAEVLLSWTAGSDFSATVGGRWSTRQDRPIRESKHPPYWTGQAFVEWRPDITLF